MYHIPSVQELASAAAILSFVGGIILYLFKRLVTDPLRGSMDDLSKNIVAINKMVENMRDAVDKRFDRVESRIDVLEEHDIRHEEQLKTLFEAIQRKEVR